MKFNAVCAAALSAAGAASAGPADWFGSVGGQDVITNGEHVPGQSPLELCDGDHSKDIAIIERVDLTPNPPLIGTQLIISAAGNLSEPILKGASVEIEVKYGPIRLLRQTADFCEQTGQVDLECPIEKGQLTLSKTVDIPNEVPPGTYEVKATVINSNKKPVTCLHARVNMERPNNEL